MKVVVDTNVLVSALLNDHGQEAAVLFSISVGEHIWCISQPILDEYRAVLRRPKFPFKAEHITALLKLALRGQLLVPAVTRAASPDEADNRFLECAEAAAAEFLVTGNARHFPKR